MADAAPLMRGSRPQVVPVTVRDEVHKLVAGSQPDTTRRRHRGSPPTIIAGRFIPGGVLLGVPFVLGGVLLLLAAAGLISIGEIGDWPRAMVVLLALPFLAAGLGLIGFTYLGLRNARRIREGELRHPGQAWYADYPWDETGTDDGRLRRAAGTCLVALCLTAFLAPFNLFMFANAGPLLVIVLPAFDLVLLCLCGASAICLVRLLRFGSSRVWFGRFPFFLGRNLEVRFLGPRSLARAGNLTFTLRCIIGEPEETSQGRHRTALYQVYADSCSLAMNAPGMVSRLSIDLLFPLPEGDYQTCLSGGPLRYWELHVKADQPASTFQATFLVPVYAARP